MKIIVSGINHKTAPIEIREKLSFSEHAAKKATQQLIAKGVLNEAVLISTCNRTEIYGVVRNEFNLNGQIVQHFSQTKNIDSPLSETLFYQKKDQEAVQHLFRVAAGLDSMVVGEAQVLGQVKQAYNWATEVDTSNSILNKLFHYSFRTGKRVRTETGIGEGSVSIGSVAVELAQKIFQEFSDKRIALIGAGKMAKHTIKQLMDHGAKSVFILNRTFNHARDLAADIGGYPLPFNTLSETLISADMVISSTTSEQPILDAELIRHVMAQRKNRPLFLIDIAVPRNVDPDVKQLYNTYLYNIDDLQNIVRNNLNQRQKEIPKSEKIVQEETEHFMSWYHTLSSVGTIQQIKEHFEELRQQEVKRNRKYFQQEDWESMNKFSESLLKKFLHSPIMRLKSCPESGELCQRCTVKDVFGLEDECREKE